MDITIKPVSQIRADHQTEFLKHSENRQAFINMIKEEVGQEVDLENPVPIFQQID